MKYLKITLISAIALGMFSCGEAPTEETTETTTETTEEVVTATNYPIDVTSSTVNWAGGMVGGAYGHNGTIALAEGNLEITGGTVTNGSFTIDMTTITPTDSSYSEDHPKENLIGHLMTADFFDVENNPTATFVVKSAEGTTVTGDLTIRGITVEEQIENVTISEAEGSLTATGTLVFDRQKHEVSFENTMNDMVLSDEITINVSLTGNSN